MKNSNSKTKISSQVSSWAEWFDRCAQHYQDPRMKMAYYKDGATGEPVSMETLQAIHEDVWEKLNANSQHTLLDVGSGIGLFVQTFQNRLQRIVGTDIALTMMKDAASINPRATFLQCDVSFLPFSSKTFDRLLCYSVFHYLQDDAHAHKTIDEFRRVVKPDGLILIGDVLYPPEFFKENPPVIARSASQRRSNLLKVEKIASQKALAMTQWWPSCLNHRLKKKIFPPEFFRNYCQKNGWKCEILTQDIKGKNKNERYDVAIRV